MPDPSPPVREPAGTREELGRVYDAIEERRARLRGLSGRVGILGEAARYSVLDEELIIRDAFDDRRAGFFLDVGCAWPVRSSSTCYLERLLGWRGIAIDALAEYGPEWAAQRPASRFFSYVVTDRSGSTERFFRSPNPGLSSTDRDMAAGKVFGDSFELTEVAVPTITLDDLLDREGVTHVDLVSMDLEGHEARALAGFVIERLAPELVVIERAIVTVGAGTGEVAAYFRDRGYEVLDRYDRFDPLNLYFAPRGAAQLSSRQEST